MTRGEQDDDSGWDMDDPNLDPPQGGQPPFSPHPPPSMPPSMPSVVIPTPQQPMFPNPDETVEQVMQPVADEESSSEDPHVTEPERVEIKQRHVSHDSDEKPPKAKAKVQIKKEKIQLPGHQNPIEVPTVKPPNDEEDDEPHPTAASSNDPTIPLPTTTPHSFTPAQPEDADRVYNTPQSSQDTIIPFQDVEREDLISTEDDVDHLNSNGSDDTQSYESEFVNFDGDYFVLLGHKSAAPDFKSYDVAGFRQFCQYFAKNGKKTPKAESVITPEVLQKDAKQIKQAKLEEFPNFLDFTAIKFRDRRKHKIENVVTGRWFLPIKIDKDGQFNKRKARWVCRGFQDAQK